MLGHRIHRRAEQRDVQGNPLRQPGRDTALGRYHIAEPRLQKHVVERDPLANELVLHGNLPERQWPARADHSRRRESRIISRRGESDEGTFGERPASQPSEGPGLWGLSGLAPTARQMQHVMDSELSKTGRMQAVRQALAAGGQVLDIDVGLEGLIRSWQCGQFGCSLRAFLLYAQWGDWSQRQPGVVVASADALFAVGLYIRPDGWHLH